MDFFPIAKADERFCRKQMAEGHVMAIRCAGPLRPPKKGEWYLSGTIPEAYYAKNDMTSSYQILGLALVKEIISYRVIRLC